MSDEMTGTPPVGKEEYRHTLETMDHILDRFNASASVEAVYQKPVEHGERLIIPTAEVFSIMGFGLGGGAGSGQNTKSDEGSGSGSGVGGGGGGNVFSRPVAVIVSTPNGVEVTPIFDITKIALAAMTTAALVMGSFARAASLSRKIERAQRAMLRSSG